MIEAYPLQWPTGFKRTKKPISSRFGKHTLKRVRNELRHEIRRLNGDRLIISTNMKTRKDGDVYSNAKEPEDSGIAIYFHLKGEQRCLACDQYEHVWENTYALACTIRAMRGIDRWGASEILDRIFTGFIALTVDAGMAWHAILGVSPDASDKEVRAAYRRKLKEVHPDAGGSNEEFYEIERAWEKYQKRQGKE